MKITLENKVREISEDTNMNEKKFHQDEFAMLLGNQMNARMEEGGQVLSTQLAQFCKPLLISPIFGLISCFRSLF